MQCLNSVINTMACAQSDILVETVLGKQLNKNLSDIKLGKSKTLISGERIAILAFGPTLNTCIDVANDLNATLVDMRFVKPIDEKAIIKLCQNS